MADNLAILETNDLAPFVELHNKYFSHEFALPDIRNISKARVIKDEQGNVIASGFVKLLTEAIIVTDLKSSETVRIKALDLLMAELIDWCVTHEIEQVHAFVNSSFSRVLMRRYGFKHIPAIGMVLDLG